MSADQNPHLGHPAARFPHGLRFLSWARARAQTTIAHQLLALIGDLQTEEALGSALAFLTHADTARALRQWSSHAPAARLHSLSEDLAKSSKMAEPLPPGDKPTRVFRKTLSDWYLAAQLACGTGDWLPANEVQAVHRLRVWLLVVAYDALLAGFKRETALQAVCTQLRMGLDAQDVEGGNPKETEKNLAKLRWFAQIVPPDENYAQFTTALLVGLDATEIGDDSGLNSARTSLKRLARFDFRHVKTSEDDKEPEGYWFTAHDLISRPATPSPIESSLAAEDLDVLELPVDPNVSECGLLEVRARKPMAASELHAVSRRIAYQTQEDRQYLNISWTRLSPWEQEKLRDLIADGLTSTDHEKRLLAALTVVAIVTKLSMRSIGHVHLASSGCARVNGEPPIWTLDIPAATLTRNASRHVNAAPRTDDLQPWTQPITERWELRLSAALLQPLTQALQSNPTAATLSELYPGPAEKAFNDWTSSSRDLWRISSGFLTIAGEQQAFEESRDATFSRLLFNWPSSSTAGAMAYPGWNRASVASGLQAVTQANVIALAHVPDHVNAMGSRLSLIDSMIVQELERASKRLAEIAADEHWVVFHNAFTAYCVTLLLIETGARPSRSVFERLSHFDLARGRLFVDDKASLEVSGDKCGRVIPLPNIAVQLMNKLYLPYLRQLIEKLQTQGAPLAAELSTIFDPHATPLLPLFFLLKSANPNNWDEVTEGALSDRQLFDWPLPPNVFRHRMATELRRAGLDPELVDAQLGHAEAGAETFSDLSTRCWADEESQWRHCIERSLAPLALALPTLHFPEINGSNRDSAPAHDMGRPFGSDLRKRKRAEEAADARNEALQTLDAYLSKKGHPSALSHVEWEKLRDTLIFDDKGNARPAAHERYLVFQRKLDQLRRELGIEVSVKTWVLPQNPGRAAFGSDALQAHEKIQHARNALNAVYDSLKGKIPSRRACAWICITDLAVNSGISDAEALTCVATATHERMGLIVIGDEAHLEICREGRTLQEGPVKRFMVSARSLPLLNQLATPSSGKVYERKVADPCAAPLEEAFGLPAGASIESCISWLRHWSDHYNCLHRPGIQGGVLSGRIETYSLSRTDLASASFGERLLPVTKPDDKAEASVADASERVRDPNWRKHHKDKGLEDALDARSLLFELRQALSRFHDRRQDKRTGKGKGDKSADIQESKLKSLHFTRADASAAMRSAIRRTSSSVPKNILLLANWAVYLLEKGSTKRREVAGSTVKRYMDALTSGFKALSHSIDITDADPEEVTDFYQHVIDPTLAGSDSEDTREPKEAQQYVLDRLVEFHRYAERFGAVSPYWDQISEGLSNSAVSPGFVSVDEYLLALERLCPDPRDATPTQLQRGFFLLLIHRFGVRGQEAIHLSMRNWVELADTVVLIVDHRHLRLKTPGSRRKVPLLEPLTGFEREVVEAWFDFRKGSTDFSSKARLLVNVDGVTPVSDLSDLRAHVTAALRWATNNPDIKPHHARHSLGSVAGILTLVEPRDLHRVWATCTPKEIEFNGHARKLLLGTEAPTRRAIWAISRLLGHSRSDTTCASYLHFLLDWCAQTSRGLPGCQLSGKAKRKLGRVTYLDDEARALKPQLDPKSSLTPDYRPLSAAVAMEYLRSRSRGVSSARAGTGTFGRLSHESQTTLESRIGEVALRVSGNTPVAPPDPVAYLAGLVPEIRWPALLALAKQCDAKNFHLPVAALEQVTQGMQLILGNKEHFNRVKELKTSLGLHPNDIAVRVPARPRIEMEVLLKGAGLEKFLETPPAKGKRHRIDSYTSNDADNPITYQHRFALVVPPGSGSVFTDGLGLLVLWACVAASDLS